LLLYSSDDAAAGGIIVTGKFVRSIIPVSWHVRFGCMDWGVCERV